METRLLSPTPAHLQRVAEHLRSGQLAAIPTETVYGLAGHALDPQAVTQIFATKDRPQFDPLITHIAQPQPGSSLLRHLEQDLGLVDLSDFSPTQAQALEDLVQQLWPGPLTVVLPRTERIPDLVTSGLPMVGVRMPRHPVAQQLLQMAQIPLAAPSANRFGRISPTSAEAVWSELHGRIPYILDGGECEIGVESTVIQVAPEGIVLLRPGGISLEQLRQITILPIQTPQVARGIPTAPGQLSSHYAPSKPLLMLPAPLTQLSLADLQQLLADQSPYDHLGILAFAQTSEPILLGLCDQLGVEIHWQILSATGDLAEAARTLFAKLRWLDQSNADLLLTEPCPTLRGLGHAITDRLRRASAKRSPLAAHGATS